MGGEPTIDSLNMDSVVYLNHEFMPVDRATIGVFNGGWLHGAGLFETMRAENGRVFRLQGHLKRLRASAERLLTPIPEELLPDADIVGELLARNGLSRARVRLTVTAGDVRAAWPAASDGTGESRPLTVCMTAAPMAADAWDRDRAGWTVQISRYRQSRLDPLVGHKTTNHLSRLVALNEARRAGCGEALWFSTDNALAEGSISNVFVVKEGVLTTPPLDTPVLPGIARGIILELCHVGGIRVREDRVTIDQLLDADEIFLTNVIRGVTPVTRIERRSIGEGRPGPVTAGLADRYFRLVKEECGGDE